MDDFLKNINSKFLIIALALIAAGFFIYIYTYDKRKSDQVLIVEKRPIKVRLLEARTSPVEYVVKIQDVSNGQIYDDIFVSKICPLYDKNQQGKIMDIDKIVLYKVQEDIKEDGFDGLYDYLCTNKMDNKETPNNSNNERFQR